MNSVEFMSNRILKLQVWCSVFWLLSIPTVPNLLRVPAICLH